MPHLINPTISNGYIDANFSCTEPETALCHLYCSDLGCEESFRLEELVHEKDGTVVHITSLGWDNEERHVIRTSKSCSLIDGLTEDWAEWSELYTGPKQALHQGEIALLWNGAGYDWTYPS